MTFDETPPPSKTSPLVDDDLDEEEAIREIEKKNLENDVEDETIKINEIVNIKESRNHPLKNIIGNLNQRTLRSQAQNQSNFYCFISTIEPKNVNEALGDESWIVAMQEELNQFIANDVLGARMVDNTLFTKKKSSNLIIIQIYVDDIIFGLTCQDMCDEFAKIMHDEFEMSMMGELNFFLGLQIKQMEDGVFFNQSKYIKEMLKKFGLEDSKPMKTPMSSDTKLTKDEECKSVDSTKYRGMIGTTHLGLWYPKGTGIETVVYADSDHAGDYVERKSTSGISTFVGYCLTSWFSKKQIALAISTTKAEYVSAGKACQQALWMKQALIDYDVRLDDVPIMCDNKGAIDLSKNPVQHSQMRKIDELFREKLERVDSIHVNFDELPQMASDHVSSDPGPQCSTTVLEQDSLSPGPQSQENVPQVAETVTTSNELELLYSPMFSELLNGNSPVVSKSSVVHAADNPDKRQQHNTTHTSTTTDVADPPPLNIHSTHQTPTQVPTVTAPENIIQAETNTENA
ncbi:retrovirus-related pol polyprotein from transposon TNT 1-94 [Tanacetum coccineum]